MLLVPSLPVLAMIVILIPGKNQRENSLPSGKTQRENSLPSGKNQREKSLPSGKNDTTHIKHTQ